MRTIEDHKVEGAAGDALTITVADEPGSGGANHLYMVSGFDTKTNPSDPFTTRHGQSATHATILFQNGPIGEVGINGITHEALLSIVADRLQSFQGGPFRSDDNSHALFHILAARNHLQERTRKRLARGVEGTHTA